MLWEQQYHRQWPVLSRHLAPEQDVDWKDRFIGRYRQEKEKRTASKGLLQVTLNFFKDEAVEAVLERIAVVKRQIRFQKEFEAHGEKVMESMENKALASEFKRWMELFLEGTSFLKWHSFTCEDPDVNRIKGSWKLFLPTHREGLIFKCEGNRVLRYEDAAEECVVVLRIHEGTSGKEITKATIGGDNLRMAHKRLLHRLLKVAEELRQVVLEEADDDEVWKTFPWVFMIYLRQCIGKKFVEEERGISYTKEQLRSGCFNFWDGNE